MPKYFDESGNPVEDVFTKEELETKNQEAIDNYIKENPDKSEELDTANKAVEEANNKIKELEEDGGGDDEQKKRLIKEKKDAENSLEGVVKNFTKQINDMKEGFVSGAKTKMIEKLSGGDEELKKKIEHEYDFISEGKDSPANDVDVQDRLTKAFTLATGAKPEPNFMDGMVNAGGKGNNDDGGAGGNKEEENNNSKNIRKVLDISDEDVKNYEEDQNK